MVTPDGAGASHGLITRLDQLVSRPGRQLTYSVGWELGARERAAIGLIPQAWQIAIDQRGEVRRAPRRSACANRSCEHSRCWIEEAHVTELTGLLREGPGGDQLDGWPESMRVFARRKRPHPGAQLSLFETRDGWRYSLWVSNVAAGLRGWRAQLGYIDAAHRVHARVEDCIRTGKDCGIGRFGPHDDQDPILNVYAGLYRLLGAEPEPAAGRDNRHAATRSKTHPQSSETPSPGYSTGR